MDYKIIFCSFWASGPGFGSKGQVSCVSGHFTGRCGGLHADGGVVPSLSRRRLLHGAWPHMAGRIGAKVGQCQCDGPDVVESQ